VRKAAIAELGLDQDAFSAKSLRRKPATR